MMVLKLLTLQTQIHHVLKLYLMVLKLLTLQTQLLEENLRQASNYLEASLFAQ